MADRRLSKAADASLTRPLRNQFTPAARNNHEHHTVPYRQTWQTDSARDRAHILHTCSWWDQRV